MSRSLRITQAENGYVVTLMSAVQTISTRVAYTVEELSGAVILMAGELAEPPTPNWYDQKFGDKSRD